MQDAFCEIDANNAKILRHGTRSCGSMVRLNAKPSRRGSIAFMPADGISAQSTTLSLSDTSAHGGNPMAGSALQYCYTPLHQNIICSETAIAALPATVDALGASRAMITCGPTILRAC